jgi:hypothetical protein
MDKAGHASTDCTVLPPSDALKEPIMKKLQFLAYPALALFSLAATLPAHAAAGSGYEVSPPLPATSLRTRAEVKGELAQARAEGTLLDGREGYDPVVTLQSTLTRADVRAEVAAARAAGQLDLNAEGDVAMFRSQPRQAREASHVVAGLKTAR